MSLSHPQSYAKAWYRRGGLLESLGDCSGAARCLREAVALRGGASAAADWQRELEAVEERAAAAAARPEAEIVPSPAAVSKRENGFTDELGPAPGNALLPAASPAVEMERDPVAGRGLRVRSAVRRGEARTHSH